MSPSRTLKPILVVLSAVVAGRTSSFAKVWPGGVGVNPPRAMRARIL